MRCGRSKIRAETHRKFQLHWNIADARVNHNLGPDLGSLVEMTGVVVCVGLIFEASLPPSCYLGIFLGYCGVCCREYANIHQHREIHQYNKQPIACPFCAKTFSSKNSMRVHKSLFHRDALRKWLMTVFTEIQPTFPRMQVNKWDGWMSLLLQKYSKE